MVNVNNSSIVPEHINEKNVWNNTLDAYATEWDDPYRAIARLHDGPDIIWLPDGFRGNPAWVLTRYELVREAFLNHELFSARENADVTELLGVEWKLNPLEYDPPEHQRYRPLLQSFFAPAEINKLDSMVKNICDELVADLKDKDGCEFIADFASLFPSKIFLDLMGLPQEDLKQFLEWETTFFRAEDVQDRVVAARSILAYLNAFVEERKNNPKDDLITRIISSTVDGRAINYNEFMGMIYVLFLGGLDTVLSTSGWIMNHLAGDQALQQRLRENPDDIPQAIEELLRAYGVTQTRRVATKDFEFHGVHIKKGESVLLPTFLANRDPRQFENPHEVDIDRKARHLTFATGAHNCLGIHLARRELRVVIETFLSTFDNIRIKEGEKMHYHTEGVWGINHLPLAWG